MVKYGYWEKYQQYQGQFNNSKSSSICYICVLQRQFISVKEACSNVRSPNPPWIVGTQVKREPLRTIQPVTANARG